MMNVKLPNGQIVKNVPDGTTKEELKEKLNNSSIVSSWENNESTFTGEEVKVAFYNGPKSELWSTDKADQYKKEIASGTSKEDAWKKTGILEGTAGVGLREDIGLDGLKFKTGHATRLGDDTSFVFNLKNVGTTNLDDTWIGEGYMKKDEETGEYYTVKRNALTTVGETIEHPTLFKHYPWLKNIPIELVNPHKGDWDKYTKLVNEEQIDMAGGYYPGKDKWEGELGGVSEAGIEVIENKPVRIVLNVSSGTTAEAIKDTLVEEIQHLLDDYENDNFRSVTSFEKEVNAQSKQNQLANPGLPPFAVNGKTDQEAFADEYYKNGVPRNSIEALYYVKTDLLNRVNNKYTRDYPRRIKEERQKIQEKYYDKNGEVKKELDKDEVLKYTAWFEKTFMLDNNEKYAEILAERELLKKPLTDKDVKLRESSNNPLAQNPNTTASGLYQMTMASRKDAEMFDKSLVGSNYDDPAVQERYRAAYKGVLTKQLKSKGVLVNTDNINRAWVIGAGGMSLLNKAKPEQMLIDVLPSSYFKKNKEGNYINPNLINKSVKDFMNDPDPYSRKTNTTLESVSF